MSNSDSDNEKPIPGDILRKAFDGFDYIGIATKEVLVEALEQKGIAFDDKHTYTLDLIESIFADLFGKDATLLLVQKLRRFLDNLKWVAISMLPTLQFGFLCITKGCICFFCICPDMAGASISPM